MFDFAETTKDMTAVEILNYYRNLYYAEPQVTERGIVANAINDYFKQTANKSGWISVDERLPERMKPVLVCIKGYLKKPIMVVSEMLEENGARWSACAGFTVTHWMPLPEPPKGDYDGKK